MKCRLILLLPSSMFLILEPLLSSYISDCSVLVICNRMNELNPLSVTILSVCHAERLFWAWVDGVIVHDSQTRMDPEKLSKDDVLSFIHQNHHP